MIRGGRCSACPDFYACDLSGGCLKPEARARQANSKPFQELAQEFRRLAAKAEDSLSTDLDALDFGWAGGKAFAWEQAAQMLEERLNG